MNPYTAHTLICPLPPLIIYLWIFLQHLGLTLCHLRAFVLAFFSDAPLGHSGGLGNILSDASLDLFSNNALISLLCVYSVLCQKIKV